MDEYPIKRFCWHLYPKNWSEGVGRYTLLKVCCKCGKVKKKFSGDPSCGMMGGW